jgi:hypothetical protein
MITTFNAAPDLIRGLYHRKEAPDQVRGCTILTGRT